MSTVWAFKCLFSHTFFYFSEEQEALDDIIWDWKEVAETEDDEVQEDFIPDCNGMTATNPKFSDDPLDYFQQLLTDEDFDLILVESNRK